MSVHTPITANELSHFLLDYELGQLLSHEGLVGGITNTLYKVTTSQGCYSLTLFEALRSEELPFYTDLNQRLFDQGLPCAAAIPDKQGVAIKQLKSKPCIIAPYLPGEPCEKVTKTQCAAIGDFLAKMHVITEDQTQRHPNQRGQLWHQKTAASLLPVLRLDERELLEAELAFQSTQVYEALPQQIIHADLFRDNALFEGEVLTGVIDFYYACTDHRLMDLAIVVNDWARGDTGLLLQDKTDAILASYESTQPLTEAERRLWPAMLRRAALRFWLSRLHDAYLVDAKTRVTVHDPEVFAALLRQHQTQVS